MRIECATRLCAVALLTGCAAANVADAGCASDPHRQFDFWTGEWHVHAASAGGPVASSDIRLAQDGCVVVESYRTLGGQYSGMSLSFYDARLGEWRQTWIDATGSAIYFRGHAQPDGAIVMHDRTQPALHKRVRFAPGTDGTVRQLGERSRDGGETWYVVFDGRYVPRGPQQ